MKKTVVTLGIKRYIYELSERDLKDAAVLWLKQQTGMWGFSPTNIPYELLFAFREDEEGKTSLEITQDFKNVVEDQT